MREIDRRAFLGLCLGTAGAAVTRSWFLEDQQKIAPLDPDSTPTQTPPQPELTPTPIIDSTGIEPPSTPVEKQFTEVTQTIDPEEEIRALRREHISSRSPRPTETPTPAPTLLTLKEKEYERTARVETGVASYYSRAGCFGCSPDQRMANGEIFDENALTIACMRFPLGSIVEITNLTNGISVIAEVTDQGGFEAWGRVADLSLGTKKALKGQDLTRIKITLLRPKA